MINNQNKLIAALSIATLSACGGGSSDSGGGAAQTSQVVGAVSGLTYVSRSYSGTTDADGAFRYTPGEEVSFSLGELDLGTVTEIGDYVSFGDPVNIENEVDPYAMNLQRLIMALDADQDPSNGIELIAGASNITAVDLTDEAAVAAALAAIDPTLQLPTQQESVAAYDAALFVLMEKNIPVASYESITSYLVPAVAPATNSGCQIYTGATFDVSKDANGQTVYSGNLLNSVNTVESFSYSGSQSGYTDAGSSIKMWNLSDESGLLSINGAAHLSNSAITGSECRQQIRMKKTGLANKEPIVKTASIQSGMEGCTTQANLNIINGGNSLGAPYSVTTYVSTYDPDGTLDSVVFEPFLDDTAQTSIDFTQTLGTDSTTAIPPGLCTESSVRLVMNYSWDDSVTPPPHLLGCYTTQVACDKGYHDTVTVTDNSGAVVSVSSDKLDAPDTTTDTSVSQNGSYSFSNGNSGYISGVYPYYSGGGATAYTDDTFYSIGISYDETGLAVNDSITAATTIFLNEFYDTNGDGVVTGADGLNSQAFSASGTMTFTNLGTYYVYQFTGSTSASTVLAPNGFDIDLTINITP